jgi:hypothetical protein
MMTNVYVHITYILVSASSTSTSLFSDSSDEITMGVRLGLAGDREVEDAEDAFAVLNAVEELVDVVIDSFATRDVDASDLSDEIDWKGVSNGSRIPQKGYLQLQKEFPFVLGLYDPQSQGPGIDSGPPRNAFG